MEELPGPVREKVQISPKSDSEHPLRSLANKYYTALVNGDLKSLEVLTDRYYEDVNLVFEISKNEMEWQVKSQSSYGLSGTFYLKASLEQTLVLTNLSGRGAALVQPAPGWLFLAKVPHPKMLGASFACFSSAHTNPPEGQGHVKRVRPLHSSRLGWGGPRLKACLQAGSQPDSSHGGLERSPCSCLAAMGCWPSSFCPAVGGKLTGCFSGKGKGAEPANGVPSAARGG